MCLHTCTYLVDGLWHCTEGHAFVLYYIIHSTCTYVHICTYTHTFLEQGKVEYSLAVIGLRTYMYRVQSTSSELASVVVGGDLMSVSLHVCQVMSLPVPAPLPCIALPTSQEVQYFVVWSWSLKMLFAAEYELYLALWKGTGLWGSCYWNAMRWQV